MLFLALAHVLYPAFERRFRHHSARWVAFSAGIAIGYVFLYLMPKVAVYTHEILVTEPGRSEYAQLRLYLIALLGLLIYVGYYREAAANALGGQWSAPGIRSLRVETIWQPLHTPRVKLSPR